MQADTSFLAVQKRTANSAVSPPITPTTRNLVGKYEYEGEEDYHPISNLYYHSVPETTTYFHYQQELVQEHVNGYKNYSAENTFIQPEYANASNNYFPEVAQAVCLSDSSFVEVIRGTPWEYSTEQTQQKNKTPKRKKSSSKENLNQNDDPSVSPSKRSRRNWTDEEESRFMEALELFGRDWYKCAEYMETRDVVSCRSHAQKVFIKLWINGDPLPQKVAEQGSGYTVSGKPLDPDSSFVRYYISLFDKRRPSEENANF